ncbi:hypothetical protein GCE86_29970 [Micromonospora terminaliae]|uniref:Uncharacterized protein n=1 Tax=Micromonospora terminaliae TaxID=1914461 RepID=A0AAJ2ZBL6_9ACTN|nr:hypothetical protein [Micromonospora terminaliae]NES26728.1 hypothetical protein [Micromonospora terminaliae]QGL50885.1 hypothetical protein GCE86_29970 [Micromonospora terminaliae]
MRHLGTVLAAAIVGPLAWILFALGQDRSEQAFAAALNDGALASGDFVRPALVLAAAGLVLGLIATLRFSPLGAALTGLAYSASYLGLLVNPTAVAKLFDHQLTLSGHQVDLAAPLRTGTTLLVGSLLLVGVVSIRRWQRWPQPAAETPAALQADEIIPPATQKDRPLGVDGLGLSTPRGTSEPELVRTGGSTGAGGSDWAGRSDWAGLLSGGSAVRSGRSSDWPRQRST